MGENGIGQDKYAGDPSPGDRAKVQVGLDARPRDRDTHTVEVGDNEKQGQQSEHSIAISHELSWKITQTLPGARS